MAATVAIVLGPPGAPAAAAWVALPLAAALVVGSLAGHGETPFRCGVAIAVLNVMLLVLTV
jgi:class 3 adenylate cyclase